MEYSAGCSSTRSTNFSRYASAITLRCITMKLSRKNSTNKKRRLCSLQMGQHMVLPGSHARILGVPGKIHKMPSWNGEYASLKRIRIMCDVHVESLFLFPMILVNTHHASRITRMWSRGFKVKLLRQRYETMYYYTLEALGWISITQLS